MNQRTPASRLVARLVASSPLTALVVLAALASGCQTNRPLPATYLGGDQTVAVAMVGTIPGATMRDSGQGGLIGAMVTAGRQSDFRKRLDGVEASAVASLVRQQVQRRLEEKFYIEETSDQLMFNITLNKWGWFVPTTALGIKAGSYRFEIIADIEVVDKRLTGDKQVVGKVTLVASEPLPNEPGAAEIQAALEATAEKLAKEAVDFLLGTGPAPQPIR